MQNKKKSGKKIGRKVLIVTGWLLLWQIIAWVVHNPIYFAGPVESVKELLRQAGESVFRQAVAASYARIMAGMLLAGAVAYLLAFAAWRIPFVEELLQPFVSFIRSVPVAAVVVVFLIWSGAEYLVFYISFMVVFPNLYGNLLTGLKKVEPQMQEMAQVFRIPFWKRLRCIYRPAYLPYLKTGLSYSIGMCFKSGVAAEIIGLPDRAIGTRLYMDKIYLNTAGVFAWMAVIVFLSFITERLLSKLVGCCPVPKAHNWAQAREMSPIGIALEKTEKSYADRKVLAISECKVPAGESACICGPSGSGKTTLLHILAGLIPDDRGQKCSAVVSICFQENRLWEEADAEVNLWLAGCDATCAGELYKLLPEELCKKPVRELSGGEKRRVALARAVLAPSEWLLLDEPFTGLDEALRKEAIRWVLAHQKGRPILAATHEEEDVALLGARKLELDLN